jgi:fatty-acyl-CoA synthase
MAEVQARHRQLPGIDSYDIPPNPSFSRRSVTGAPDYVALQAKLQPASLAARDLTTGARWTYEEFDRGCSQFGALLQRRGIRAGDRVAVLAKNRVELAQLHLGCARIGAIYVPLNWRLAASELDHLVADAQPGLMIADTALRSVVPAAIPLEEFAAAARCAESIQRGPADADAPSLILYTSGTSGRPKGVLLSERNIWQTGLNFSVFGRVTHTSVVLCDSPMFHVIGLVTNIRPVLMRGGSFAVSDAFIPARTLDRLADPSLAITHYFCVPQMAAMLRAEPSFDPAKLRGLTAIFSGGAPHAADAIRAWCRDGIPIADGFGMSEAGTVSCMPLDIALIGSRAGAAGLLAATLRAQVRDAHGAECPPGVAGELFIQGESITSGYWRQPDATRDAFDEDGWFRTGDIGRFDEGGFLWLIDRKKDMFISGGENVYPAEIEGALAAYDGIAECAVVGVADERWGEVGHLAVVPMPGVEVDRERILAHLELRLARYKLPKHVSNVPQLPRNAAGKVLKAALRAMLASGDGA